MSRKVGIGKWQMMEMGDGITTSNGFWYQISAKKIEEYIPDLLKKTNLEKLVKQADAWVLSADGLSLLLFFVLVLTTVQPLIAFSIALVFYFIWFFNTSAFISVGLSNVILLLSNDGFIYSISAVLLIGISLLGTSMMSGVNIGIELDAVWYGIALIFLFKVGILRLILTILMNKSTSKIPRPDRIFNMLLIRYGMHFGILTKSVNEMQDELIRIANYHKTRKKTK